MKNAASPDAAPAGDTGGVPTQFHARMGGPEDHAFIFATWLRSYRHTSTFARLVLDKVFYRFHHEVIARILARGAVVRVMTPLGEPGLILGYAVFEPGVLHFVYVKKPARRMGIARGLLAGVDLNACVHTHWTKDWDLLKKLWPHCEYNPYLI